jgi:hypothetical protein
MTAIFAAPLFRGRAHRIGVRGMGAVCQCHSEALIRDFLGVFDFCPFQMPKRVSSATSHRITLHYLVLQVLQGPSDFEAFVPFARGVLIPDFQEPKKVFSATSQSKLGFLDRNIGFSLKKMFFSYVPSKYIPGSRRKGIFFLDQPFQSIPRIRCWNFILKSRAKMNLFGEFHKKNIQSKQRCRRKKHQPHTHIPVHFHHCGLPCPTYRTPCPLSMVPKFSLATWPLRSRAPPACDAKRLSRAHRPLTGLPTAGLLLVEVRPRINPGMVFRLCHRELTVPDGCAPAHERSLLRASVSTADDASSCQSARAWRGVV